MRRTGPQIPRVVGARIALHRRGGHYRLECNPSTNCIARLKTRYREINGAEGRLDWQNSFPAPSLELKPDA